MDAEQFRRQRRPSWNTYSVAERDRAVRWKSTSPLLPAAARADGPYASRRPDAPQYPFCLPMDLADHNLLPDVRQEALAIFRAERIAWHKGVSGGPTNHLLSSQVQCVNALAPLLHDENRLRLAFGGVLELGEIVPIEPGRLMTFEYVGPAGFTGIEEGRLSRGANCTSVDAAFEHQRSDGGRDLVLVEWKYTEKYTRRAESARSGDVVRARRYMHLVSASAGPVRSGVLGPDDLFSEPFYQLMRQQLLAAALEGRFADEGIDAPSRPWDRVVVVHVAPVANTAYQASLNTDEQLALGTTVSEVWRALIRDADRFVPVDSAVFLNPEITSPDYVERYGGAGVA